MKNKLSFIKAFFTRNLRLCEFALTNVCSCKCTFCSIWKQKPKVFVNTKKALKTIDKLVELNVKFITLTGGEPLIHPDIIKIARRSTYHGIKTAVLNADPRLLTDKKIKGLKEAGIDYLCISIDHYDDKVLYKARSIKNLYEEIKKAVNKLNDNNIHVQASILISKFNHKCLEELFDKCKEIGFRTISVNYPEFSKSPVYALGGKGINLTKGQVIKALEEVIRLKKHYRINNQVSSMKNIIKYLKGEEVNYPCYGGSIVFFVDWFFKVYPCMHKSNHFGDVLELNRDKLKKVPCNSCNMSWYRDFSIYFHGLKSIKLYFEFLKDIKTLFS